MKRTKLGFDSTTTLLPVEEDIGLESTQIFERYLEHLFGADNSVSDCAIALDDGNFTANAHRALVDTNLPDLTKLVAIKLH